MQGAEDPRPQRQHDHWQARSGNLLAGGLEPLRGCTALQQFYLTGAGVLTGGLEPLRGCTVLRALQLGSNQLTRGESPLPEAVLAQLFCRLTLQCMCRRHLSFDAGASIVVRKKMSAACLPCFTVHGRHRA
eukprot:scaffold4050_cov88-Phaeocystis_antarctica.AAC.5